MKKENDKKSLLKDELQTKSNKKYLNIVLAIIVILMALYTVIENFNKLRLSFDFDVEPKSLLVFLAVIILAILGVKQCKKSDIDSSITGILLLVIILFISFGGILTW